MKMKFKNLISVKSIVTIMFSIVFCILSLTGKVSSDQFLTIFSTVIAFYFGTQHEKKNIIENKEVKEDKMIS